MMTEKDERSDEDLARAVQGGETDAFGTIVLRYEDKLRRYAKRFLLADEVDDLLQDIFLSAFENICSFDSSRKFSPWIYRIAHNMFVNAIRKRSLWRAARIDFDTVLPILVGNDRTDEAALRGEEREMLDVALPNLDMKYREVIELYYVEGFSYQEIADILGIPKATVGVRLQRARKALRSEIRKIDETFSR